MSEHIFSKIAREIALEKMAKANILLRFGKFMGSSADEIGSAIGSKAEQVYKAGFNAKLNADNYLRNLSLKRKLREVKANKLDKRLTDPEDIALTDNIRNEFLKLRSR